MSILPKATKRTKVLKVSTPYKSNVCDRILKFERTADDGVFQAHHKANSTAECGLANNSDSQYNLLERTVSKLQILFTNVSKLVYTVARLKPGINVSGYYCYCPRFYNALS